MTFSLFLARSVGEVYEKGTGHFVTLFEAGMQLSTFLDICGPINLQYFCTLSSTCGCL